MLKVKACEIIIPELANPNNVIFQHKITNDNSGPDLRLYAVPILMYLISLIVLAIYNISIL